MPNTPPTPAWPRTTPPSHSEGLRAAPWQRAGCLPTMPLRWYSGAALPPRRGSRRRTRCRCRPGGASAVATAPAEWQQ
eukprot:scaffold24368_cov63-Phaeocystis_antarctica.AAC.4